MYNNMKKTSESSSIRTFNDQNLQKYLMMKVHDGLRNVKPEAYEPMLVSIGPYHYKKNSKLEAMEKHKKRYLHSCLHTAKKSEEQLISELEQEPRWHYVDPPKSSESSNEFVEEKSPGSRNEFVEMMLHDGCFIIEFFRRINGEDPTEPEDDSFIKVPWNRIRICLDLILLENQLPYVVLNKLYTIIYPGGGCFKDVAIKAFDTLLLKPQPEFEYAGGNYSDIKEIKHLLHLVHFLVCRTNRNPSEAQVCVSVPPNEPSDQRRPLLDKTSDSNEEDSDKIRCVVKLQEASVTFKKGKGDKSSNLLDINFDNRCLELPCFNVVDSTETFFRNLIAYEQHLIDDNEPRNFSYFVKFMDKLIDSEDDVKVLCDKGIIVNSLGDDKAVAELFNKLCKGVIIFYSSSIYSKTCRDIDAHCKKTWNHWMASLKGNYFINPWVTVSTIAAAVLLILTLLQTVLAFLDG